MGRNRSPHSIARKLRKLERQLDQHIRREDRSGSRSRHDLQHHTHATSPPLCNRRRSTSRTDSRRSRSPSTQFRRIRRISSSPESPRSLSSEPQDHSESGAKGPVQDLDRELLSLLGEPEKFPDVGPEIHMSVLDIWKKILHSGFEQSQEVILKHTAAGKLSWLMAPDLNPEIKAILPDSSKQRDARLAEVQQAVGASLMALGGVITQLLKADKEHTGIIGTLSDAARLLCGVHHTQSTARRSLIGASLRFEKPLQEAMADAPIDSLLYGADLNERVAKFRTLQKASADLKPKVTTVKKMSTAAPKQPSGSRLNSKSLPRPTSQRYTRPGRQQKSRNPRNQTTYNQTRSGPRTTYTYENRSQKKPY